MSTVDQSFEREKKYIVNKKNKKKSPIKSFIA